MTIKVLCMLMVVFALLPALAAGTTVSIKDASANTSESIDIPIEITGASNVGSMDLEVTYDPKVLNATQVKAGTLTGGAMLTSNITIAGKVTIGIMTSSPFNGDGSVAIVTFKVIGSSGDKSPLTLTKATAIDATTFQDAKPSTLNGTFTVGIVTTTITIKDASADAGASIDIPIEITGASNVGSMDLEVTYDPKVLNATQVKAGTLTSGAMVSSNLATSGKVIIGIITTSPFNGEGSVAIVTFEVIGSSGETSPLTLTKATAIDATTHQDAKPSTKNGTFTVVPGLKGDFNGNGRVDIGDVAKVAFMAAGKIPEDLNADFNGDGKVDSEDANKIAFYLIGKIKTL